MRPWSEPEWTLVTGEGLFDDYNPSMIVAAPAALLRPRRRVSRSGRRGASRHWSLARQYFVASLIVVLAGVLVTGAWIGHQIESSVLDRTAGITALYVDSVLSPHLQALARDDRWLTAGDTAALNTLVGTTGSGPGCGPVQDLVARWTHPVLA